MNERIDILADALADVVAVLASASSVKELERTGLEEIRRLLGAPRAGFYVLDPSTHQAEHSAATGVSDYFLSRYEEAGRGVDPLLQHILEHQTAVHNKALMSAEEWQSSELYSEVLHLHQMTNLLEAPIVCNGRVIGTLNFGTAEPDKSYTEQQVGLATAIGRLVGVSLQTLRERESLERDCQHLLAGLELCDEAVVLTDLRTGQRRYNSAARRLLERLRGGVEGIWVDELMASETDAGGVRTGRIDVQTIDGGTTVLRSCSSRAGEDPSMWVTFLMLEKNACGDLTPFVQLSLTAREYEVAGFAALGLRDGEIAERLLLSPHTVKEYLKNTYRKLNVRSRVELARLFTNSHHSTPSN